MLETTGITTGCILFGMAKTVEGLFGLVKQIVGREQVGQLACNIAKGLFEPNSCLK